MRHSDGDTNMQGTGSAKGFWGLLSDAERHDLSDIGLHRTYPPGATMCVEGDPATHVFVLVVGQVKILSATNDGQRLMLALRGDGDIVGEIAGATTGHRNATVQAVDTVQALIVPYGRFNAFLESNPAADRAYKIMLTRRLSDADAKLRTRSVTTGAQRLAGLLLELADRHGIPDHGQIQLTISLSQEEWASLAGTSRATVTRALSDWRKRGFIRTGQRRISIVDQGALRRVSGSRI
jgi:CRP/FNR family transcriptional regulator, cyclic AMP receptor protein